MFGIAEFQYLSMLKINIETIISFLNSIKVGNIVIYVVAAVYHVTQPVVS